ncbi:DNA cytosine methyltransferase, partial [Clostridium paraputrificum]
MKAVSLFSSAGIGEMYLKDIGINVVVANELVEKRARVYKYFHRDSNMICGDITDNNVKDRLIELAAKERVKLMIATPPCQGMSLAGKNKSHSQMKEDRRNYLIFDVMDVIDRLDLDYILIENVSRFLKHLYPYNGEWITIEQLLKAKYGDKYNIKCNVFNAADLGIPQTRVRAIIRMYKYGLKWHDPKILNKHITLKEAIGDLPSIESGDTTNIKNHWARKHPIEQVEWMKHTASGNTAIDNEEYYPKKDNGDRIKGYRTCYKRMSWDKPALTITMRNEIISSQNNVHPGRLRSDGTWSDARVLTLRELLIVSSLDGDLDIPEFISDTSFRHLVGEGVPPLMLNKILEGISDESKIEMKETINGISLFSGGGVGETYFKDVGINIVVANELVENRAKFYQDMHPNTTMVKGDIRDKDTFEQIMDIAQNNNVRFLVATPPCQGMSTLGKKNYEFDERNYLI